MKCHYTYINTSLWNNMNSDTFKILSIDGGGIRGVFPTHILSCISKRLNIDVTDYFDMIAGTSTGSIVAGAIALKKEPSEIISLYKEYGIKIFPKNKSFFPDCIKQKINFGTCLDPHFIFMTFSINEAKSGQFRLLKRNSISLR